MKNWCEWAISGWLAIRLALPFFYAGLTASGQPMMPAVQLSPSRWAERA
jgi:hypothetical protein